MEIWKTAGFSWLNKSGPEADLTESNTLHIKSKAIKMLSCKNFATLLNSPLWPTPYYTPK